MKIYDAGVDFPSFFEWEVPDAQYDLNYEREQGTKKKNNAKVLTVVLSNCMYFLDLPKWVWSTLENRKGEHKKKKQICYCAIDPLNTITSYL